MLASGTVFAKIGLPNGMDMLLQVHAVYPEQLVYDGPVPDDESTETEDLLGGEGDDDDLPDRMTGCHYPISSPPTPSLTSALSSGSIRLAFH